MKKKLVCLLILCSFMLFGCEQKNNPSEEVSANSTVSDSSNKTSDGSEYSMENVREDLGNGFYILNDDSAEEIAENYSEYNALVFLNAQYEIKVISRYNRFGITYGSRGYGYNYLVTDDAIYYYKDFGIYKINKKNPYDNKLFYSIEKIDNFAYCAIARYEDHCIVLGGDYFNNESGYYETSEMYLSDDGSGEYHLSIFK